MLKEQLDSIKGWFDAYVKNFYSEDAELQAGIRLKEMHTARVCDKITCIGRSVNLNTGDLHLAEAIAIFHDVGRFRQYTVYRTFNDRRTENHALLGLRELEQAGVLSSVEESEKDLIKKAIEYHNISELPRTLEGRCLLFTSLIRDADKLDILDVFTDYYTIRNHAPNPALESGLPDTPEYSPVLVENLLHQKRCSYNDMKNYNDRKLLLLSWVYDINFPYTFSEILRKGYIEKIIDLLPKTKEIQAVYEHLKAHVAKYRPEPLIEN